MTRCGIFNTDGNPDGPQKALEEIPGHCPKGGTRVIRYAVLRFAVWSIVSTDSFKHRVDAWDTIVRSASRDNIWKLPELKPRRRRAVAPLDPDPNNPRTNTEVLATSYEEQFSPHFPPSKPLCQVVQLCPPKHTHPPIRFRNHHIAQKSH